MELLVNIFGLIILAYVVFYGLVFIGTVLGLVWIIGILLFLGAIVFSIFGPPGLLVFIIICVLSFSEKERKKRRSGKRRLTEKQKYQKWQQKDEELEDYDYLDDITGHDDKWWI